MINPSHRSILTTALVVLALAAFAAKPSVLAGQGHPAPEIKITEVPPSSTGGPDEMFPISGTVTGVEQSKDYRVVVYVFASGTWFVQPFDYAPLTEIKDGKFDTVTHGGSIYAALLVRSSYKPKAKLTALPDGSDIIARYRVTGGKKE